jgi:hypothetical protein
MKRPTRSLSCLIFATALLPQVVIADSLEMDFKNPPASVRPLIWWHWMYGNLSREGITSDLESMASAGFAGTQLFTEATLDVPGGPVRYHSREWYDMMRHALATSKRLGMTVDITNCAGWSEAGGPWIKPEQSMKQFVWSEYTVTGPGATRVPLPKPTTRLNFYRDIAVLAVPADEPADEPFTLTTNSAGLSAATLHDGNDATGIMPTASPADFALTWTFAAPVERRLLQLTYRQTQKGGAPLSGRLEASDDGVHFRSIRDYAYGAFARDPKYLLTIPFAPVRAQYFRVTVGKIPANLVLTEAQLSRESRIENFDAHATRMSLRTDRSAWSNDTRRGLPAGGVIDLTARYAADGQLAWAPPAGRWKILRLGYTTTGKTIGPASPESGGLEVDKMDAAAVAYHFQQSLGEVLRQAGADVGHTLVGVLCDSWEAGRQTWSANFPVEFKKRRGYEIGPWLPALTGRLVGTPAESEAFLADYRRTIADVIAENFYGTLQRMCHEHGLRFCAEAYGSESPLNHSSASPRIDLDMDEFWTHQIRTGMASTRTRAGLAHVLGRSVFGAESFTNTPTGGMSAGWAQTPLTLKQVGDLAFVSGVNLMVLASYVHQPRSDLRPGLTLGVAGTHFGRLDTWWGEAGDWVNYLARCQHLLQQGQYVADLLLLSHDDMDNFVAESYPRIPPGFDNDSISPALFLRTSVQNGRVGIPGGTTYAAIVLPDSWTGDLALLEHLAKIKSEGVPVVGPPPLAPEGLMDIREHAAEWHAAVARLWPTSTSEGFPRSVDSLRLEPDVRFEPAAGNKIQWVHRRTDEAEIYFLSNQSQDSRVFTADFRVTGMPPELWDPVSGSIAPVPLYQNADGRTQLELALPAVGSMFVVFRRAANPRHVVALSSSQGPVHLDAEVRIVGHGLEIRRAGTYQARSDQGATQELSVAPLPAAISPSGPWRVVFHPPVGRPFARDIARLDSWSDSSDKDVRYFSGTATFRTMLQVPAAALATDLHAELDLGNVGDLARLRVNGRDVGLVWTPPFALEVTPFLHAGDNEIEIAVTNAWANRMIGDERLPNDVPWEKKGGRDVLTKFPDWYHDSAKIQQRQRVTFASSHLYDPSSPLLPGGLMGPVALRFGRFVSLDTLLR